jgi:hypothetical protein
MSYQLTSTLGTLEAVIDDNCGMKKFNSIVNMLLRELKVKFLAKQDDSDTVDWHFKYKSIRLLYTTIFTMAFLYLHKIEKTMKL